MEVPFSTLIGKTLTKIVGGKNDDEIRFTTADGREYRMYHAQDCCEYVYVEDIIGDLDAMIGEEIITAEEIVGLRMN